jgi:hypothetical protein
MFFKTMICYLFYIKAKWWNTSIYSSYRILCQCFCYNFHQYTARHQLSHSYLTQLNWKMKLKTARDIILFNYDSNRSILTALQDIHKVTIWTYVFFMFCKEERGWYAIGTLPRKKEVGYVSLIVVSDTFHYFWIQYVHPLKTFEI